MPMSDEDAKYLDRIAKLGSVEDCEQFAKNCRVRAREDLAIRAEKRAIEIAAELFGDADEITKECIQAINAYERSRTTDKRRFRATRTWQMLDRRGAVGTIERSVSRPKDTMGFETLESAGFGEFAFEHVVLRYPSAFTPECIERAKQRLNLSSAPFSVSSNRIAGSITRLRNSLKRSSILNALLEAEALGRNRFLEAYGYGEAKRYQVLFNGQVYDSKAIYGVAHKHEIGFPLKYNDFSGGEEATESLKAQGFVILDLESDEATQSPEEADATFHEGATTEILVNKRERDPKARAACLKRHGYLCAVCSIDFGETFGADFAGLIHVHHVRPLSANQGEHTVNAHDDLIPVCPNCHAMIHHGSKLRSINEMKNIWNERHRPK